MKGEALITIKTKDGKIKQQIRKKNVVFDVPREAVKYKIKGLNLGGNYAGEGDPLNTIINYRDWFRAIYVNSENCSGVDCKDWKMPVLFGGEYGSRYSNNKRYAVIDDVNSVIQDNVLIRRYLWNDCPAFELKSINIRHYNNVAYNYGGNSYPNKLVVHYGKFYWLAAGSELTYGDSNAEADYKIQGNTLYEADGFKWAYGGREKLKKYVKASNVSGASWSYFPSIVALKKNNNVKEIALIKYSDSATEDDNNSTFNTLVIINAETGAKIRSFAKSQFVGILSGDIINSYTRVITTDYGNFLYARAATGSFALWLIPDIQTSESIAKWADIPDVASNSDVWNSTLVLKNFIFILGAERTIRINSATAGDYTEFSYLPFNNTHGQVPNTFGDYSCYYKNGVYDEMIMMGNTLECWFNTTALNLSEPVSVAAGDTLVIEYTITAN